MLNEEYNGRDRRQGLEDRRDSDNWYTNKELFEKIQEMNEKVTDKIDTTQKELTVKIDNLQNEVRKYNNLNSKIESLVDSGTKNADAITNINVKLNDQITKCNQVQDRKQGQWHVVDFIKDWWPIILSTLLALTALLKGFGAF